MKHIKQLLTLILSALVAIGSIKAQDVDRNDSIFQADIQIISAPASKDEQKVAHQKHISPGQSVVNFAQIVTSAALVGGLSVASGLVCNRFEQKYFANSPKLATLICWGLWGIAELKARIAIGEQLAEHGIAVSPTLMGVVGRLASWGAYLGYLDKYIV